MSNICIRIKLLTHQGLACVNSTNKQVEQRNKYNNKRSNVYGYCARWPRGLHRLVG